jgi:hypothetical protein
MNLPKFEGYITLNEKRTSEVFNFGKWKLNEQGNGISNPNIDVYDSGWSGGTNFNEISDKAAKIIQLSKLKIARNYPFYVPFLDIMAIIPAYGAGSWSAETGRGTMSTDGTNIYYDPRFVVDMYQRGKEDFKDRVSETAQPLNANMDGEPYWNDYVTFVIVHEIMHNSLKHFDRTFLKLQPPYDTISVGSIHQLWNIAQDYEINRMIVADEVVGLPILH